MTPNPKLLEDSVALFLDQLLGLQRGENVLVYFDETEDKRVALTMVDQAKKRGASVELLQLDSKSTFEEQVGQIVKRIHSGGFQVLCEYSAPPYFYLSPAWAASRERRMRSYSVAGLDSAAFVRCVGQVDHQRMIEFGRKLKGTIENARFLKITSQNGTDLQMELGLMHGLSVRLWRRLQRQLRLAVRKAFPALEKRWPRRPLPFIFEPCGFLTRESESFLGGQLSFRGIPATIGGTAVIDGYLCPPLEIGLLDKPITLKFEKGILVDIGGCPAKSKILGDRLHGGSIPIEHFSIGFNPGAEWTGKLCEVERIFGALTLGFGQKLLHTDGVMRMPTLIADGKAIEKDGRFVATELLSLQEELLAQPGALRPSRS